VNSKKKDTVSPQEAIDKEFANRVEQMKKDLIEASNKNMVEIVPILDYKNNGIKPIFGFADAKQKYEQKPPVLET